MLRKLFTKTEDVHSYNIRLAYSGNFYVKSSRLETQKFSFSRSGSCIYNCLPVSLRNKSKKKFKQQLKMLLKQMHENEDNYIGVDKIILRMPYFQAFINTKTHQLLCAINIIYYYITINIYILCVFVIFHHFFSPISFTLSFL